MQYLPTSVNNFGANVLAYGIVGLCSTIEAGKKSPELARYVAVKAYGITSNLTSTYYPKEEVDRSVSKAVGVATTIITDAYQQYTAGKQEESLVALPSGDEQVAVSPVQKFEIIDDYSVDPIPEPLPKTKIFHNKVKQA